MKMLEHLSGIDVTTIPMNDAATMSIFSGVDALMIDTTKNTEETGAAGLPEFGTPFVRGILKLTHPTTFDETRNSQVTVDILYKASVRKD